jgi:hypothetical protein
MSIAIKILSVAALCCVMSAIAAAQQQPSPPAPTPPAKPTATTAQSEAGEPRADTSSPAPADTAPAAPAAPVPKPTAAPARAAAPGRAPGAAPGASKIDRLDLGTATVTGSQEQPKVMYIVPWKRSDIGDLAGKPMNSLVDEILAPVDRDVFKREVVYYQAVQADASQNGAPPKPAQQGEK